MLCASAVKNDRMASAADLNRRSQPRHRRGMNVEITGGPAMSVTDGLGHQGGADHLDAVPAS
jgi:hypothetical protein